MDNFSIFYVYDTPIYFMFGNILTQRHFNYYSINQMAYDVNLTAPNNKFNAKSLLDFIQHHYSNMSVVVVEYDVDYNISPCLCAKGCFTK